MRARLQAAEVFLALAVAWLLVFVLPFRLLSRRLGTAPPTAEHAKAPPPRNLEAARALSRRIVRLAPRFPGKTTCLVRAAAGWLLLARRGVPCVVRFGVRKSDGVLEAHAWLLVGDHEVLGGEGAQGFVPIADLGGARRAVPLPWR